MNVQENVNSKEFIQSLTDDERKAEAVLISLLDRAILDNRIHRQIDYDDVIKRGVPALLKMKEQNSFDFFR